MSRHRSVDRILVNFSMLVSEALSQPTIRDLPPQILSEKVCINLPRNHCDNSYPISLISTITFYLIPCHTKPPKTNKERKKDKKVKKRELPTHPKGFISTLNVSPYAHKPALVPLYAA